MKKLLLYILLLINTQNFCMEGASSFDFTNLLIIQQQEQSNLNNSLQSQPDAKIDQVQKSARSNIVPRPPSYPRPAVAPSLANRITKK